MEFLLLFLKPPPIEDQDHKGFHYNLNDIRDIGFLNNSTYFCIRSTLLFSKKNWVNGFVCEVMYFIWLPLL